MADLPCGKLCSATQNWIYIVYQNGKKYASRFWFDSEPITCRQARGSSLKISGSFRLQVVSDNFYLLANMPRVQRRVTLRKSRILIHVSWHGWSVVRRKRYFLSSYIWVTPAVILFSRRCSANLKLFWCLIRLRNGAEFGFALMPALAQTLISITPYGGVSPHRGDV